MLQAGFSAELLGGAVNNERYSTLDRVNTSNVQNLKGAWLTRLGSGRGAKYKFGADPLVIDGTMCIPTGNDDIFALDAKTGKKIWDYQSDIPQVNDLICCGWDNCGVGAGEGKIFSGQLDGSFVALDQKTGKIAWRTQLEDYRDGYGSVIHTATDSKGAWNTGDISSGQSASVTFDTPGTYVYSCSPHPWMIADITVK